MNDQDSGLLGRRCGAFVIDWVIAGIIDGVIWIPWIMLPIIQGRIDAIEIVSRNAIVTAIAFLYLLFRDVAAGGSFGKTCLGLRVVRRDDPRVHPALWQTVTRNVPLLVFPVEAVWFLATSGRTRLGDSLAGTIVVRQER